MENIIYSKTIVPAKDSQDGETPTVFYLTKEVNGFMISLDGYDGLDVLDFMPRYKSQSAAIERAVELVSGINIDEEIRKELAKRA